MLSKKYLLILGAIAVLIIVGIFGFLFLRNKSSEKAVSHKPAAVSQPKSSTGLSNGQTKVDADTTNGLQLYSASSSNNSASAPAGGSTSAGSAIDPSTFSQYDKYKDGTTALYAELKVGDGATLSNGQTAVVVYKGWLTNGQVFDQSRAGSDGKIQAFSFQLGAHHVIPGWEQAMAGMKVGGVRLLIIPPSVGYGASGQGPIPPNSVLVFQVQLVAVQ